MGLTELQQLKKLINILITFPKDFLEERHSLAVEALRVIDNPVLANMMLSDWSQAKQWTYPHKPEKAIISIVGGGSGLYGDGVTTFEMYDFREDSPRGYMTKEEINKHLEDNPV